MKRILLFLIILTTHFSMAQNFNYEQKWKEIKQLSEKGNLKSLLPKVNDIYSQAKKENNTTEIINALIYQSQITSQTQEDEDNDSYKLVITNFEKEISSSKGVTQPVLQSLLAKIYQNYMNNSRWNRKNSTDTETQSEDISTWTSKQLLEKSLSLYKESIQNTALLQKEKTENWKKILTTEEDFSLYPTLYDVLVNRYLSALAGNYYYIENDSEIFEKNKSISSSLLTDLINFHKSDADKSAFLNYKLIEIIQKSKDEKPEQKSEEILALAKTYPTEKFSSYLYYVAARNIGETDKVKAFAICKNVALSKENPWSVNCHSFQKELQKPYLSSTIDATLLPNENIPLSLTATNLDKVYYRIYEVNPAASSSLVFNNSVLNEQAIFSKENKNLIKNGTLELKHFDDYSNHSTLVKLDGLPQGSYKIEFANNSNFTPIKENTESMLGFSYFMVDDWTLVEIGSNQNSSYQLVNRKTGKSITNQPLQLFKRLDYSNKNPKILSAPILVKTDADGVFIIPNMKENRYTYFYVYHPEAKSYIQLSSRYYYRGGEHYNSTNNVTSFFTDRAIYRPGQKVYFKAIVYTKNKEKTNAVKNKKISISLSNPNGEQVSTLELTSNEYGSVFGEFILPQGGLTGGYRLNSNFNGNHYFSVEEYKRPKFEVSIDKLEGEYTLEKEVKTTGKAVSFAGAPISDAKVVYRVERQEIFPYYRWYYPPYSSTPETIAQGEIMTDNEGKFEIPFIAKPKEAKKDKVYRTYTYTVYVDVTDINGETHSTQSQVTIGDLPKKLTLVLPDRTTQKELAKIGITSTNLNEVKETSKGKISITSLESPTRILLPNKLTSVPEYQLYTESEFSKLFPYLPYSKEELNPESWKKGTSISYDFDTQKSDSILLKSKLSKGYYLVEALTMYGKDSIKTQKILEVLDDKTLKSTDNLFYSISTLKSSYKVGETIEINFFSDLKEASAILHIESDNKWIEHKEIPIKNGKGMYSLPAKPEYLRDGLFVSSYLVKENGVLIKNISIDILDKPRELKITTKVFRDKMAPGAKETWELTISGKDKDKITAEVLAAMYDASLDSFASNSYSFSPWYYSPYGSLYQYTQTLGYNPNSATLYPYTKYFPYKTPSLVDLKDYSMYGNNYYYLDRKDRVALGSARNYKSKNQLIAPPSPVTELAMAKSMEFDNAEELERAGSKTKEESAILADFGGAGKQPSKAEQELSGIQARTNLQETAFFYPNLYTDENGNVKLTFTSPEALTKWKLLLLAHTQDLQSGTAEFYTQTQKDLMVVPNVPRFLREGDEVTISTKINNLSAKKLAGNAQLFLFDAMTNQPIDSDFGNKNGVQSFKMDASKNAEVNWTIKVPKNVQAVTYRVVAKAGDFSDGEESILPVLTNRMLVTETLPISIKENQTKEYRFDKLIENKSSSLQNFNLSLEITTNPTWLAVLSLPYLREYPYECSEQLFSRLYGNILSTYILNSSPKIKKVFDNWNAQGINISNLEKNQELKNILLEETPWIRNAESENEQRKRIALLFDLNKMSQENSQAQTKLIQRQNSNGGFSWFDGGYSSPYITETIILGFGQLKTMLGAQSSEYLNADIQNLIKKAIQYTDEQTIKYIKEQKKNKSKIDGKSLMHYYYVRSFWKDQYKLPSEISAYLVDINKDIPSYFKTYDLQNKALTAVVLNRYGYKTSAQTIINNLKETSVEADEMGMYWKDNKAGWYWYQSPVEAQTKAIEAFAEVTPNDVKSVEEMKVWLLKNRQTNSWNSTKATTNAVYALMNFGKDWSNAEDGVNVFVGKDQFFPSKDASAEQASGYIKQSWKADQITPEMGVVKIEKTSPGVAWGGMYWQYFEDLDKITKADTNIKMQKQLFLKVNTDKGKQLQEITDSKSIKVGDLVTIKLIIKVDRDMQYIHIKDMRASGFEPVNVLSGYKYQNGAGYYESTRDAATNFFFERLTKGTYLFEYDVRANNKGDFSNGITQLQNMYAPEMSAHSEGIRVKIK